MKNWKHWWPITPEQNKENMKRELVFFAWNLAAVLFAGWFGYWFITSGFLKLIYMCQDIVDFFKG